MKKQKLIPSGLAAKLAPVKIDENSKFGTSGRTSNGTMWNNVNITDYDSWND